VQTQGVAAIHLGPAVRQALDDRRRGALPVGPLAPLVCWEGQADLLRGRLLEAAGEVRRALPPGTVGRRPRFVAPAAGFEPAHEGWFLDLLLVREGPTLLLAYRVEADGRLRPAWSHGGFLRRPDGEPARPAADELARDPVVGDPARGGPALLGNLVVAPLCREQAGLERARQIVAWTRGLAGPDLELVRRYRFPAPPRPAEAWRARSEQRSAAEEAPYVEALLTLLEALDPAVTATPLHVHDPACHHGTVLVRLGERFPELRLGFSDVDPHWVGACQAALAQRGLSGRARAPSSVAEQTGVQDASVDLLLLRALNRGVVSYAAARRALARAAAVLRPGGLAVVYGYSFPLLNGAHFAAAGLTPLVRTLRLDGSPLHTRGVVPFYLLTRDG